jgi:hypothetical protein
MGPSIWVKRSLGSGPPVAFRSGQVPWSAAKWLHEEMTKGMAALNATCCMDREDEEESCINVVKCEGNGMEDSADGWKTPEVSGLDMEGANNEEVLIVNMMRAEEEEPPKCLTDKEEFLA